MSAPLISVITPTFNCGARFSATAASVFSQEAGLYEFLVVDGGSTDDTLDRLRAQGPAVHWLSEPDAGIYDAMNKGIRLARGKFLYFLGAGDCLRPGVLRAVADRLPSTEDGREQFVYGDVNWLSLGIRHGGVFNASRLTWQNVCHQAIFYSRGIFNLLGDYDLRYKTHADFAMNIRCFGHPAIRKTYLDLIVADFEGGGSSGNTDEAFNADWASLVRANLGPAAGLRASLRLSTPMRWASSLNYHLRQPWRTFPGKVLRRLRGEPRRLS